MTLSPRHRSLVFALALALWFASTWGLLHRTVHPFAAPLGRAALTSPGLDAQQGAGTIAVGLDAAAPAPGRSTLFNQHLEPQCRLYDQLAHGASATCVALIVLPMLLPTATFVWLEGEVQARWSALLRARGPPLTR